MFYFLDQAWKYQMRTAMTVAVSAALMVVLNGRAEAGNTCLSKATEALPRIAGLVVKKSRTRPVSPTILASSSEDPRAPKIDETAARSSAAETRPSDAWSLIGRFDTPARRR